MALYPLVRPLAFALDAERAHRATIRALKLLPAGRPAKPDPVLAVNVAGLDFPNPVGLAAGFDKDAEVWRQMLGFGFGFVEVGTVTPMPQAGNEKPRLFRLAEDRAVINRMGFNNRGQAAALARLAGGDKGLVGVNIGANKDSADRDRGLCRRRADDAGRRRLSDGQHLLAQHAGAARAAGQGRARRAARSGDGGARASAPPRVPQGRARSGAGGDRRHRPDRDRPAGRCADRRQHDGQPALAEIEAPGRGGRPFGRAAEAARARAAARFPRGEPAARCR